MSKNVTKEEILRSLCYEFVVTHLPDEADLFDPIWDAFWKATGCETLAELGQKRVSFRSGSAVRYLGAGPEGSGKLGSLVQFLSAITLAAARFDAHTPDAVDIAELESALRGEADRLQVPGDISKLLDYHGVGLICAWFRDCHNLPPGWFHRETVSAGTDSGAEVATLHVGDIALSRDRSSSGSGEVWLDTLDELGTYTMGENPVDSTSIVVPSSGFLIVIDERNKALSIASRPEITSTVSVSHNHLTVMYLAMTHVGKTIGEQVCLEVFGLRPANRNALHKAVQRYREFIGKDLGHAMIQKANARGFPYCVPMVGWSFWWLRIEQQRDLQRWLS